MIAYSEKETAIKAKRGDHNALMLLIQKNFGAIQWAVDRYKGTIEEEDLMQTGQLAMVKAITKFDPSKNIRFYTYAHFWIREYINRLVCAESSLPHTYSTRQKVLKQLNPNFAHLEDLLINPEEVIRSVDPSPEELTIRKDRAEKLSCCLSQLTPRERYIVKQRSKDGVTYEMLAGNLKITRQAIDQIAKKAYQKLKICMNKRGFYVYKTP